MTAGFSIYVPGLSGDIAQPDVAGREEVPSGDTTSGYVTDLSFITELWNAGPIGRSVALQIADSLSINKKAEKK